MFLGARSLRRTGQLNRCARVLARHDSLLQISDGSRANPGGSSSFLAEGKAELLGRTKVLLNVHRAEDSWLEWLRVLDAIHAGAVVVTEHSSGIAPLVPGEDLLTASFDSLACVLEAALRDGELLGRLRARAHERIRTLLPFALYVSVFRAAAVEIVGRPVSSRAARGRQETELPFDDWTAPAPDGDPGAVALRRSLKEMSIEVIHLRREVARLEQIVRSGADAPLGVEVVCETPSWSSPRARRVTVITALCEGAREIGRTFDSLDKSWFRDFELVIVDDASRKTRPGSHENGCTRSLVSQPSWSATWSHAVWAPRAILRWTWRKRPTVSSSTPATSCIRVLCRSSSGRFRRCPTPPSPTRSSR